MTKNNNAKRSKKRKVIRIKNLLQQEVKPQPISPKLTEKDKDVSIIDEQLSYDQILTKHHTQAKGEIELLRQNTLAELEQVRKNRLNDIENEVQVKLQQGYEDGYSKGYQEGQTKLEGVANEFLGMLNQAVEEKNNILNSAGQDLLNLSFKVAEKIIQTQLNQNSTIFKNILEEAISQVTEKDKVLIRVSQADFEAIQSYRSELEIKFKDIKQLDITADSDIAVGGCIIETKLGYIDSSIATKKELIQRAFTTLYHEIDHPDTAANHQKTDTDTLSDPSLANTPATELDDNTVFEESERTETEDTISDSAMDEVISEEGTLVEPDDMIVDSAMDEVISEEETLIESDDMIADSAMDEVISEEETLIEPDDMIADSAIDEVVSEEGALTEEDDVKIEELDDLSFED